MPIFTVRVGRRILVESSPPFRQPVSSPVGGNGPSTVVAAGSWPIERCPRGARCFAFTALRPGGAFIAASTPSGCNVVPGHPQCVLGLVADARVYVEPANCDGGAVRISPVAGPRKSGPLTIRALASTGRADRTSTYTLVRFSDSDPELKLKTTVQYDAPVNWGEGLDEGASQIVATGRRSYELRARHFYCNRGVHTATVTIMKTPAAIYHPLASIGAQLHVTVAGRR